MIAIDGVPIDEVWRRLGPLASHDNMWGRRWVTADLLCTIDALRAVGLGEGARVRVTVERRSVSVEDGSVEDVSVEDVVLDAAPPRDLVPAYAATGRDAPLRDARPGEILWFQRVDGTDVLYAKIDAIEDTHGRTFEQFRRARRGAGLAGRTARHRPSRQPRWK